MTFLHRPHHRQHRWLELPLDTRVCHVLDHNSCSVSHAHRPPRTVGAALPSRHFGTSSGRGFSSGIAETPSGYFPATSSRLGQGVRRSLLLSFLSLPTSGLTRR